MSKTSQDVRCRCQVAESGNNRTALLKYRTRCATRADLTKNGFRERQSIHDGKRKVTFSTDEYRPAAVVLT